MIQMSHSTRVWERRAYKPMDKLCRLPGCMMPRTSRAPLYHFVAWSPTTITERCSIPTSTRRPEISYTPSLLGLLLKGDLICRMYPMQKNTFAWCQGRAVIHLGSIQHPVENNFPCFHALLSGRHRHGLALIAILSCQASLFCFCLFSFNSSNI